MDSDITLSYEKKCEYSRRYSRQILVPQFGGIESQVRLSLSRVGVVGAGGIGSTVLLYLAGCGVGEIVVIDHDRVEESNLHRQIIHRMSEAETGQQKALSACERIKELNPLVKSIPIIEKVTSENALDLLRDCHVVIDATDNYEARYAINDACVQLGIPLVSGSAGNLLYLFIYLYHLFFLCVVGMEGQVTVLPCDGLSPCYRCLYPKPSQAEGCRSCANAGISLLSFSLSSHTHSLCL